MLDYTISEISRIVDGKLFPNDTFTDMIITQVITDSRHYFQKSEAIFIALAGPRNNGHNYISDLIEADLQYFIVSEKDKISEKANFILVENTTEALQKLASFNRQQINFPVIGITGSNGKTIVKEWLFELLSNNFKIVRSPKSYNSQIGVALSVLLIEKYFNLGIFEAGISLTGEMKNLEKMISPEIGIFTSIGDAHQKNFVSVQQKIQEKLLLFTHSKQIIYNCDHKLLHAEIDTFCKRYSVNKTDWSLTGKKAKINFNTSHEKGITKIEARIENNRFSFSIPFSDNSSVENACHCFATIYSLTENPVLFTARFPKLVPVEMRLEIKQGINNCLLINDYYNSDLNSLSIALSVLQQQAAKAHLKKIAILSDIQQTGLNSVELYAKVNSLLNDWKIDEVYGIGPEITANSGCFSNGKMFYHSLSEYLASFNKNEFQSSVILIKGARQFTFEKLSALLQQKAHQTVLEIDLNALVNNLNVFRSLLKPQTKIMAMVKAFSYGSGDIEIAKLLQFQRIDYLAVAVADEGVQLRNSGIKTPIIVMNPEQHSFQNIIDYKLEPNIYSLELFETFVQSTLKNSTVDFPIHLKIDTGMNRLGFKHRSEIEALISRIKASKAVKIKSVFSHLAASDNPEMDNFTLSQISLFEKFFKQISKQFKYKIDRHILNSAGIEQFPDFQFEMVRLGIGLYGISVTDLPLENIGTLKSVVSQVKEVAPNETVGYNRKGEVSQVSKIAIVPLGYADGLDRKLGNKNGYAFVNGKQVPIIGNICMDMLMLDVTNVTVKTGDEVEFFGKNISINEVAKNAGTIPYEILTGISQRVKRIYLQE